MDWDTITALWNSIPLIGALFGAFFAGDVANKLGRRKTLIIIDLIVIVGSAIQLINNFFSIMIGRIIVGVGAGAWNPGK